jgi:hypothetical protein
MGVSFRLNNRHFSIANFESSNIFSAYQERKRTRWNLDSIQEVPQGTGARGKRLFIANVTEKEINGLSRYLVEKGEYEIAGYGIILNGGEANILYVYKRVPKFATQDGRNENRYWAYDSMRVAVGLGWDEKGIHVFDRTKIVEYQKHIICVYENNPNIAGWNSVCNSAAEYRNYGRDARGIVSKLSDAVNVVTHPMNLPSLQKHASRNYQYGPGTLDMILKDQKPMTREDAIKNRYDIFDVIPKEVGKLPGE